MIHVVLFAVSLLASDPTEASPPQSAPTEQSAAQPADATTQPADATAPAAPAQPHYVCHSDNLTGSRLATRRRCMTPQQQKEVEERSRELHDQLTVPMTAIPNG